MHVDEAAPCLLYSVLAAPVVQHLCSCFCCWDAMRFASITTGWRTDFLHAFQMGLEGPKDSLF